MRDLPYDADEAAANRGDRDENGRHGANPIRLSGFQIREQLASGLQRSDRMRSLLPTLIAGAVLLGSASAARAQISFDIRIGQPPPPPRAYRVPLRPGPDYEWVEGYWYPQGSHYLWHNGYWTRPPYAGAYWVEPYYEQGRYYAGHWEGGRGNVYHDHRWDRSRQRDERHEPNSRDERHDRRS